MVQVNFEPDSRQQYLELLGYSQSSVKSTVAEAMSKLHVSAAGQQPATVTTESFQLYSVYTQSSFTVSYLMMVLVVAATCLNIMCDVVCWLLIDY